MSRAKDSQERPTRKGLPLSSPEPRGRTPISDVRAVAADALARIVRGASLRAVFAQAAPQLSDPRDRALLSALLHEGCRWWLRYDAALQRLLQHPLREREFVLHALLVLGLVQLAELGLPEYAAVAATVEAARTLKRPKLAGLVNAVLRRWLREQQQIEAELDGNVLTRYAQPRWLVDALRHDWPEECEVVLRANNDEAPLTVRINRRRVDRAGLSERWRAAGIEVDGDVQLPLALTLAESTDVTRLPGYVEGEFSVQDGAAQLAATSLDVRDGQRVLDACAAPGGKSAHILELADVELTALDNDAARLSRVRENLTRLGVSAHTIVGDAARPSTWWDGRPFDRILLDAPCSASGILRRQPDVRLHRRIEDIDALAATQAEMLQALWPLLAAGGRLVYATCSVFNRENAQQMESFLASHADAIARPDALPTWFGRRAGAGRQNLPGEGGRDGFFYAVVDKRA